MPRLRNRIRPRGAGGSITTPEEASLVFWDRPLIEGTGIHTLEGFSRVWSEHGERVLARYIECLPGTRPFAMYALGLLPLPDLRWPDSPVMLTLRGRRFYRRYAYFGQPSGTDGHYLGGETYGEFEWLKSHGVVDAAEAKRARGWVDDRAFDPNRSAPRYRMLTLE